MWKPELRVVADRRGFRYPSDLTDAERALVAPLIPTTKRGGRKRAVDVREAQSRPARDDYLHSCTARAIASDNPLSE